MTTLLDMGARLSIFDVSEASAAEPDPSDDAVDLPENTGRLFAEDLRVKPVSQTGLAAMNSEANVAIALTLDDKGELNGAILIDDFRPSPEPHADTVAGSTATTATIAVGGSVDVILETSGDRDWYRITLTAGTTYTIHASSDGTNVDTYLRLRDASGTLLTEDDDSGAGSYSLISYTPSSSGTYYVDASTYGDAAIGSYRISLAAVLPAGADSVGGTTGTASSLAVSGSINGRIDTSGDHDFYAITLTAGQTYLFRTGGVSLSTATDTILTLRNSAGTLLATNDDSGEGSFSAIRYTATTTGTYYLDVSGFGSSTGNFNLTAFPTATPTVYTLDQIADQLTFGYWGDIRQFEVTAGGSITVNITGLTAAGQALAQAALLLWTDVMGITFNEVSSGGQIVFDDEEDGAYASFSSLGGYIVDSIVNVGLDWLTTYGTGLNSYSFQTYIHEIGHALGLGHAGNYNSSASYAVDSFYLNDSWATTVMSYFDQDENDYFDALGFTRQFVLTPMMADLVAMADLYGTATTTRTGNTTYGFNSNSNRSIHDATQFASAAYTIVDHGGTDTLDYSGYSTNQTINLNPETFSNIGSGIGNVSIGRGVVIENATGGSGNDTITGTSGANVLRGNNGNDTITGGGGLDTFYGGAGDDIMTGGDAQDFFSIGSGTDTLLGAGGIDLIYAGADLTSADSINGGASNDFLGLQGDYSNYIFGANNLVGIEALLLLTGAITTYSGGSVTDRHDYHLTTVDANVGAGQILLVNASSLLSDETLYFNGAAETNGSFFFFGGQGADTLRGGSGADIFSSGTGQDTLTGGGGNDIFYYRFESESPTSARDHITDFTAGDRLNISAFGPSGVGSTIHFIGSAGFSNVVNQLRVTGSGTSWVVELDRDGDGDADFAVTVTTSVNGYAWSAGDFVM